MTDMRIAGVALLAVIPLIVMESVAEIRGRFNSAFWNLDLAGKLPRIAAQERRWLWFNRIWIATPVVPAAGITAATVVALGVDPWVWLGTAVVIVCAPVAMILFATQGNAGAAAARSGTAPDWLEATWSVLADLERAYVVGTSLGCVMIGIGLVGGTVLGGWPAWALIVGPGLLAATTLATGFYFPQMALLGPLILGVALVLS